MPHVVLIGTLDTKGEEYAFLRDCVIEAGATPLVIDFGVLKAPSFEPDFSSSEVAVQGGSNLEALRFAREGTDTRAVALATMERGIRRIVQTLRAENRCDAVLGAAGSGGSSVISGAMRTLPVGVPKILVSTMASGDVSGFVDIADITLMYSVTDIAGLNRILKNILRNAAYAAAGMAQAAANPLREKQKPLIALTMFGITTPGVLHICKRLKESEFEAIVFHAVGSGGRAMERMIDDGLINGVIDYTVSELTDDLLGGVFGAGRHRLEAASRQGIPQVVIPGAIEVLNFGPRNSVPAKYDRPERKIIVHNPNVCAARINKEESVQLGKLFAQKLNAAKGLTSVILPLKGMDKYEQPPDGPWIDPEADGALFDAIRANLRPDIRLIEIEANINDQQFADATYEEFMRLWKEKHK
jgi:uncharacterized protein (UPF0261 family)